MEEALSWTRIRHGFWISTNGIYQIKEHKSKSGRNWWEITENYKTNPFVDKKAEDIREAKEIAEEMFSKRR